MSGSGGRVDLIRIVEAYTKGLAGIRGVIELLKEVSEKLPKDALRSSVEERIEAAEHALQLANAEMGESLGFPLCRCSWPPQIMVKVEGSKTGKTEKFKCPHCDTVITRQARIGEGKGPRAFDPYDVY